MKTNYTFNGKDYGSITTGTVTAPDKPKYDQIEYCPFCGKKIQTDAVYCPYCGKELPQTTTQGMFVFHWNYSDGTPQKITY